jgi:hypothetical protein
MHAYRVSAKRQRFLDAGYKIFGVRVDGVTRTSGQMDDQRHGSEMSMPDMPQAALVQHNRIDPTRGHISHKLIEASSSPYDRSIGYGMVKRDEDQFASVTEKPVQTHCPGEMVTSEQRVSKIQPADHAIGSIARWKYIIEQDARRRRSCIRNQFLLRTMHARSSPAEGPLGARDAPFGEASGRLGQAVPAGSSSAIAPTWHARTMKAMLNRSF